MTTARRHTPTSRTGIVGLAATALLLGVVVGCGDDDTANGAGGSVADSSASSPSADAGGLFVQLAGRSFVGDDVTEGGDPRPLAAGSSLRLAFDEALAVTSSAGCNTIGGSGAIDGDVLVLGDVAMTEMGCPGDVAAQEQWWLDLLTGKPRVSLDGDALVLEHDGTVVRLTDEQVVEPDRPLVGTTWEITTVFEGTGDDGTATGGPSVRGTFVLAADGTFELSTPCEVHSGSYVDRGEGRVVFSTTVDEPRPCEEPDAALDAAVEALLVEGADTEIDGDELVVQASGVGLGLRAAGG